MYREQTFPPHGGEIVATGNIVWDSALVLASYLSCVSELVAGRRVIELGAGLGIPSLACHHLGAQLAVATDMPSRITLIEQNQSLNRHEEESTRLTARVLAWGEEREAAALLEEFEVSQAPFLGACRRGGSSGPLVATVGTGSF